MIRYESTILRPITCGLRPLLSGFHIYFPEWGRDVYSIVACLTRMAIDHASLARRSTVPIPIGDTFNI